MKYKLDQKFESTNLDGSKTEWFITDIRDQGIDPASICLMSQDGLIYWTDEDDLPNLIASNRLTTAFEHDDSDGDCTVPLPAKVYITQNMSGMPIANCRFCSYACAYWECACELEHDCEEN